MYKMHKKNIFNLDIIGIVLDVVICYDLIINSVYKILNF